MYRFILILLGCCFFTTLFAQKLRRVKGEYTYYAPENISLEEVKRIALERAMSVAIAETFGTLVTQNNSTVIVNQNGKTSSRFYSLGGSEVKGEWIETIGTPVYQISYEQNMLVVKVSVQGNARERVNKGVDFVAKALRNGTDQKFESLDFKNGDDLYLYFQTPIDGFLTVYLHDEMTQQIYCLLPYRKSGEGSMKVKHDQSYIFFSEEKVLDNSALVDEYILTCQAEKEYNTLYVIFSPNYFAKANSIGTSNEQLPCQLSFEEFQKWLVRIQNKDQEMKIEKISITINK